MREMITHCAKRSKKNYELVKFILEFDIKYFSKNKMAIDFVKKKRYDEYYEKFNISFENETDILNYIEKSDLVSLKKCKNDHFSENDYVYFSKALLNKNKDVLKIIYEKIENKEKLIDYFTELFHFFDAETKELFDGIINE